jgi:hypothetical protein
MEVPPNEASLRAFIPMNPWRGQDLGALRTGLTIVRRPHRLSDSTSIITLVLPLHYSC